MSNTEYNKKLGECAKQLREMNPSDLYEVYRDLLKLDHDYLLSLSSQQLNELYQLLNETGYDYSELTDSEIVEITDKIIGSAK